MDNILTLVIAIPTATFLSVLVGSWTMGWRSRGVLDNLQTKTACGLIHKDLNATLSGMQIELGEIKGELKRINGDERR